MHGKQVVFVGVLILARVGLKKYRNFQYPTNNKHKQLMHEMINRKSLMNKVSVIVCDCGLSLDM
ncbi:hypothetical protein AKO1_001035 [Acrasis kona]|uniref:Uncharacterized protein n=1 Tax=Acrasis kona TaxID=1008807 RepID=A0AAW2ZD93_9EUKA